MHLGLGRPSAPSRLSLPMSVATCSEEFLGGESGTPCLPPSRFMCSTWTLSWSPAPVPSRVAGSSQHGLHRSAAVWVEGAGRSLVPSTPLSPLGMGKVPLAGVVGAVPARLG